MPALARDANPCTSALSERGHIGCRPAHMLERWMLFAALSSGLSLGCYVVTPSQGGGEVDDLDELIAYISALRAHGG